MSTTHTINPDRLALLDDLTIDQGSHPSFESGHCSMEVVAWLADQGHTDAPTCASPVLARYVIRLNDRWDDQQRQTLKPYLPRMVGTGGDGKDHLRERVATRAVADLLDPWLRIAGLDTEADMLVASKGDLAAMRRAARAASVAAWRLRRERIEVIRAKVREHLADKPVADAAAAAAAAAAADAAAAAAADAAAAAVAAAAADAAAVAVAAAAADAAADAAAAAVAAAAADAAADAAAAAVAAAAADAAAAAVAAADPWGVSYSAAYKAARAYYDEHPLPISQEIADLAASQQGVALELLDRMIDPSEDA